MIAHECTTINDIVVHLTEELQANDNPTFETIDNETWIITHGFRRGFCYNNIFYNETSKEYAFHVSNCDDYDGRLERFPNMGKYDSHENLLKGVAEKYAELWFKVK